MPFPIVETVTVLSDIPWNIMTPQAGPSNLAYEIETHVGADPPVGIPRTPPTSTAYRIRSFMVGVLLTEAWRCRANISLPGASLAAFGIYFNPHKDDHSWVFEAIRVRVHLENDSSCFI